MIGKEDPGNEEEPVLKVTDKRKFNEDGSIREGVVLEKEDTKPAPEPEINAPDTAASGIIQDPGSLPPEEVNKTVDETPEQAEADEKDPASFINFLSTLVTNAAAALGAIPHPVTGQKTTDLDTGKYWIDVLSMLRKKTQGNLSAREDSLLTSILSDLQMQYVALNRATAEKLKAQAAEKFSSKDILGG